MSSTPFHVPALLTLLIAGITFIAFRSSIITFINVENLSVVALLHFFLGIVTFLFTNFVKAAPYGRHAAHSTLLVAANPRWAWVTQEAPTLASTVPVLTTFLLAPSSNDGWKQLLTTWALLLYIIHYTHRTLIFPFMIRSSNPMPQHVTTLATLYCTFNGLLQATVFESVVEIADDPLRWSAVFSEPLVVSGTLLFLGGMFSNVYCDYSLIGLRLLHRGQKGKYFIPSGPLFNLVSCPNYFCEFVEWVGYSVVVAGLSGGFTTPPALAAFSFAFYTAANTFPRGMSHHQLYLQQFGDAYRSLNRRAVVPFLW